MHASTWQRMPRSAAAAATGGTGSITPCAYDGAETTTSTVRSGASSIGGDHRGRVGAEVRADRDDDGLDAEVVRGLEERRVHGARNHHPRPLDVGAAVARALDGEQAGLGAAGGDRADRLGRGVEQVGGEADQVVLHLQQARERGRVQAVRAGVRRDRLAADPVDVGQARVVDVGEGAAAVHGQVGVLHGAQAGESVGHAATVSSTSARRACTSATRTG